MVTYRSWQAWGEAVYVAARRVVDADDTGIGFDNALWELRRITHEAFTITPPAKASR